MSIIKEISEEIRTVSKEPTSRDLTVLALIYLVACGLIGSYLAFWKGSGSGYVWMGVGAGLFLCRLVPPLFRKIYYFWIGLSVVLGYFVSRALLTVIFVLMITPMGLIMRLVGKDPMDRKWDPAAKSYWLPKEQEPNPTIERYEKQF